MDAWVLSRRDSLNLGPVTAEEQGGLRVFLQCMELKKHGPQELAERDCRELAFRPLPDPRGARLSDDR